MTKKKNDILDCLFGKSKDVSLKISDKLFFHIQQVK